MKTLILTEGNLDGLLLLRLIDDERRRFKVDIGVAGGRSSLYSIARTQLASNQTPVAVLMDADTPEEDAAEENQRRAEEVIGAAASGAPFRVIMAVPEIEVLFFEYPDGLRRIFCDTVTDHLIELGCLSPKRALRRLAPDKPAATVFRELIDKLEPEDIRAMRESRPIRELRDFIEEVAQVTPQSTGV